MFMVLSVVAGAGELYRLPILANLQLRQSVRAYLEGTAPAETSGLIEADRMDPLTVVLTSVDEVDTFLCRGDLGVQPTHRADQLMQWTLERTLTAPPSEFDRSNLRRVLRPFLHRNRLTKMYQAAVKVYWALDLWEPDDVEFMIHDLVNATSLYDRYDAILRMAHDMSLTDLQSLTTAILSNGSNPLVRFALLDHVGTLPARHEASALVRIRQALRPQPGHEPNARERVERKIYLRLLARWQKRYTDGDARVRLTVDHVAGRSVGAFDHEFMDRFRKGLLPTDPNDARLASSDPLGLSVTNVIRLAECQSRLDPRAPR